MAHGGSYPGRSRSSLCWENWRRGRGTSFTPFQGEFRRWSVLRRGHGSDQFGDDAALSVERELGKHRERKDFGGGVLGDREIARPEEQTLISLGEMERDWVMDAGADSRPGQLLLNAVPIRHPHHVEVVDRP